MKRKRKIVEDKETEREREFLWERERDRDVWLRYSPWLELMINKSERQEKER